MNNDPQQVAAYAVAIVTTCAAVFERLRNWKKEKKTNEETQMLSDAKMFEARGEILRKLADDNLELFNKERAEHKATRNFWHDKAGEFQVTLGACQEKLADLQNKPDFSAVIEVIRQQAATSVEILTGIKQILKHIEESVRK